MINAEQSPEQKTAGQAYIEETAQVVLEAKKSLEELSSKLKRQLEGLKDIPTFDQTKVQELQAQLEQATQQQEAVHKAIATELKQAMGPSQDQQHAAGPDANPQSQPAEAAEKPVEVTPKTNDQVVAPLKVVDKEVSTAPAETKVAAQPAQPAEQTKPTEATPTPEEQKQKEIRVNLNRLMRLTNHGYHATYSSVNELKASGNYNRLSTSNNLAVTAQERSDAEAWLKRELATAEKKFNEHQSQLEAMKTRFVQLIDAGFITGLGSGSEVKKSSAYLRLSRDGIDNKEVTPELRKSSIEFIQKKVAEGEKNLRATITQKNEAFGLAKKTEKTVTFEGKKVADYYAVLGLEPSASENDIKKTFRKLSLQYHPDTGGLAGAEVFNALNEAYEVLSDDKKKPLYDQARASKDMPPVTAAVNPFWGVDMADLERVVAEKFGMKGAETGKPSNKAEVSPEYKAFEDTLSKAIELPDMLKALKRGAEQGFKLRLSNNGSLGTVGQEVSVQQILEKVQEVWSQRDDQNQTGVEQAIKALPSNLNIARNMEFIISQYRKDIATLKEAGHHDMGKIQFSAEQLAATSPDEQLETADGRAISYKGFALVLDQIFNKMKYWAKDQSNWTDEERAFEKKEIEDEFKRLPTLENVDVKVIYWWKHTFPGTDTQRRSFSVPEEIKPRYKAYAESLK
jgi:curved DNA-binding protein CbpA